MKRSNCLVLLIGIFLAVVAFVLIVVLLGQPTSGGPRGSATPPANLPTVIAAEDIPLGATVTEAMLTTQELPTTQRLPGALQSPSQAIGQIVRQPVTAGQQITNFTFGGSQKFVVPPGQRAMSVQVDALSGVGTAIQAGDYIDMVVGLSADAFPVVEVNPDDGSIQVVAGLNSTSVKLLIEGMQVLSVIRQAAPPPSNQGNAATPSPSGPTQPPVTEESTALIILSMTAQQTELVKFAQMQGNITLVLRSAQDFFDESGEPILPVPAGTTGVILKTLVDSYGVLRPEFVEAFLPEQSAAPAR